MRRFIVGLGKKVLIANAMGAAADYVFNHGAADLNILGAWIGAVAYLMQIYFDFSGYSDMAIGLGKMFGFHFKENFNHPYISSNMQEFWRRWHISLSSWFRDYVYIPLGGNRKGKVRTVINRIIVFFLTGLWHGANWTFIVWGLFHGFFLLLEEAVPQIRKLPKLIGHIYTLLAVTVGFVIFRADTISEAVTFIAKMFSGFDFSAGAMSFTVQALTPVLYRHGHCGDRMLRPPLETDRANHPSGEQGVPHRFRASSADRDLCSGVAAPCLVHHPAHGQQLQSVHLLQVLEGGIKP
jgi:alginate O-acetyltransferase complex protein AlgI